MDDSDVLVVKNNDGEDIKIKVIEVFESELGDKYLYYEINGMEGRFISSVEYDENDDEYYLDEVSQEEKEMIEKSLMINADELGGE